VRGLVIVALLIGIAPVALWLAGCATSLLLSSSTQDPGITVAPIPGSPIDHVVVIMQENRSFDNLFNGFPGADTAQSGESLGITIPLAPVSLADPRDLDHTHPGWWQDWDNGKMDGFARAGSSSPILAYSYVPEDEVEQYWTLARQYVLGDRMFQSNTGPSFPAHLYMIAGEAADVTEDPNSLFWGCDAEPGTTVPVLGPNGTDLPGVFPCWDDATAGDLLDAKGISWRYYAPASTDGTNINSVYDAIRHIRYGSDWGEYVIYPQTRVLTDIQNGELAQVTWVIPDFTHSDHPGSGSTEGPDWVASVVNAVGNSKFWNSTAIFIAWDDWGGWYDHVVPPQIDAMGPGFRVPVLVVSPYAKHGYVSHQMHEASGFITFIEHNFGLGTLGTRDVESDAFADCFNYSQKPSAFAPIATRVTVEKLVHEAPSGPPDDD
jgi:phospholipase C